MQPADDKQARVDRLLREKLVCTCWARANALLSVLLLAVSLATITTHYLFSIACLASCYFLISRVIQYDRRYEQALREFPD